jgi:hypothetical protein
MKIELYIRTFYEIINNEHYIDSVTGMALTMIVGFSIISFICFISLLSGFNLLLFCIFLFFLLLVLYLIYDVVNWVNDRC